MKRVAITLDDIANSHNLAYAAYRAALGKRSRPEVQHFFQHFDRHLAHLGEAIRAGTVPRGHFRRLHIRDPKPRLIHAACFEDRILHHAVMQHAGPVLERLLTASTFACRQGMGHPPRCAIWMPYAKARYQSGSSRLLAAAPGYLPRAESVCRSSKRSGWLKSNRRTVTSPMSESGTMVTSCRAKCRDQRSVRGLKNRQKTPVRHTSEPMSLPLARLQKAQA